jgi:hypothetical protein
LESTYGQRRAPQSQQRLAGLLTLPLP